MTLDRNDVFLRHLLLEKEYCNGTTRDCPIFSYAVSKSLKLHNNQHIKISGRQLSLVTDGIEAHAAQRCATVRAAQFRGVVYVGFNDIATSLAEYAVVKAPRAEDSAHVALCRCAIKADGSLVLVSSEVNRLHRTFYFTPPNSRELAGLEGTAGK